MHPFICCCILFLLFTANVRAENAEADIEKNLTLIAKSVIGDEPSVEGTWTPGIDLWTPPEELKEQVYKDNRWYVSGHDYEHRPVIVWELGTSKVRKYGDESDETRAFFRKFTEWKWYQISHTKSTFEDAEDGIFLLIDFRDYPISELGTFEAVKLHLYGARIIERVEAVFAKVVFINADFISQLWFNLIKPVGGRWLGKADLFGTDETKWKPYLKQVIPADQLPPFYGGTRGDNYKPLQVYG